MDIKFWLGYLSEWLGAVAVVMIAGISPMLKKVRRIEFRYPRREASYALTLFALVYFFAFQFFSNSIFDFLRKAAAAFQGGEAAQRFVLALICLIPFIAALLLRGQPLKSAGWSRENLRAGLTVGVMLAILAIFLRGKFITLLKGISAENGSLLLVFLLLSLAEETILRGYIQLRLVSYLGSLWGWLATAGLTVLWAMPGRLWVRSFNEIWIDLVLALVQGLLLGWIMRKTGHVAAPALFRAVAAWLLVI